MPCVLIEILGRNGVAPGSGFAGKRHVTVVAFLRIGGSVVVVTAPARVREADVALVVGPMNESMQHGQLGPHGPGFNLEDLDVRLQPIVATLIFNDKADRDEAAKLIKDALSKAIWSGKAL